MYRLLATGVPNTCVLSVSSAESRHHDDTAFTARVAAVAVPVANLSSCLFPLHISTTIASGLPEQLLLFGYFTPMSSAEVADIRVRISEVSAELRPFVAKTVSSFFNERLQRCEQRKLHILPTIVRNKFEFLVRINKISNDSLRKSLSKALAAFDVKISIFNIDLNMKNLLDSSVCVQIDLTDPHAPPMISGAAVATLPPIQSLQPSNSVPSRPAVTGRITTQAAAAAAAAGEGANSSERQVCDPESRGILRSDDAEIQNNGTKSIFSARPVGASRALHATKIFLQFAVSGCDSGAIDSFKTDLSREIRVLTYQAAVDAVATQTTDDLQVNITCEWKNPVYPVTVRRIIDQSVRGRFKIDGSKICQIECGPLLAKAIDAAPNGVRWLHHSQPKGAAYTMPITQFIIELGNEVRAQEELFLKCETQAQFRDEAKAKQILLVNLHDALRYRYRQELQNLKTQYVSAPRDPGQSFLEVPPVAGRDSGPRPHSRNEAPSGNTPPGPGERGVTDTSGESGVALKESSVPLGTPDISPPEPSSSASLQQSTCRSLSLSFNGQTTVVQTPSGGAPSRSACDSADGPAGMYHTV